MSSKVSFRKGFFFQKAIFVKNNFLNEMGESNPLIVLSQADAWLNLRHKTPLTLQRDAEVAVSSQKK